SRPLGAVLLVLRDMQVLRASIQVQLAIVLVAAGASTRMGFPKLWVEVCGEPLLARAIAAARAADPTELVIVVAADRVQVTMSRFRRRRSSAATCSSGPWR